MTRTTTRLGAALLVALATAGTVCLYGCGSTSSRTTSPGPATLAHSPNTAAARPSHPPARRPASGRKRRHPPRRHRPAPAHASAGDARLNELCIANGARLAFDDPPTADPRARRAYAQQTLGVLAQLIARVGQPEQSRHRPHYADLTEAYRQLLTALEAQSVPSAAAHRPASLLAAQVNAARAAARSAAVRLHAPGCAPN